LRAVFLFSCVVINVVKTLGVNIALLFDVNFKNSFLVLLKKKSAKL
jgi:hypothetical protein